MLKYIVLIFSLISCFYGNSQGAHHHSTWADTLGLEADLQLIESKLGTLDKEYRARIKAIKVEYYSFDADGKVDKSRLCSGILLVHESVVEDVQSIFEDLRRDAFPIAKVVPINKYGLDADTLGWDDQKSMLDNNTSAFNYRRSTSSNKLSKHAMGLAIDINPLFNPYEQYEIDGKFVEPEGAFYDAARLGAIHDGNIVRYFEKRGWTWGGRWGNPVDFQHFQKTEGRSPKHILTKHNSLKDQFRIHEGTEAVSMYKNKADKRRDLPESRIYKDEQEAFAHLLENLALEDALKLYELKGERRFDEFSEWGSGLDLHNHAGNIINLTLASQDLTPDRELLPKRPLEGWRIALDPGHFAGNEREAMMENRFIADEDGGVAFFEAKNAFATAVLLKERLEWAGAEVLVTHDFGKSSTGENATNFMRHCGISSDFFKNMSTYRAFQKHALFPMFRDSIKAFSKRDLEERARKINAFAPDLTLVLHFNVSNEDGHGGQFPNADDNFSMLFVPGAFMRGELDELDARFHFMRLLLTDDLQRSTDFSNILMRKMADELGVPAVSPHYHADHDGVNYLERSCIKTDVDGVYARNLALTRNVMGPMCYVEAFCQNNREEYERLKKRDLKVKFGGKKQKVPRRLEKLSNTLFDAVLLWAREG